MANSRQQKEINIQGRWSLCQAEEHTIKREHVSLQRLKNSEVPGDEMMSYLILEMPPYPTPVEFWVSNVAHVTEESGFDGILKSEQFRPGVREFSWWGLKINEEEIREAEKRYMKENFPNQAQELNEQKSFLEKFTKSPVFQKESRYGNYRFTFPLTDLMQWYKEQNCGGEEPVLRVYETATYRKEIMYTVLIHSPEDNMRFGEYPLLEASEWVRYQDGKIIWKAQAICEKHEYQFFEGEAEEANARLKYYVWDHVCLVLHLPNDKVLKIPRDQLIKALDACEIHEKIDLSRYQGPKNSFQGKQRFREATRKVNELKGLEEE